ncbi:MAG TPA: hypothetical protein VNF73_03585, partial [Candidatus Saccharimonadales bacterium]|nr:hypothetical protein [Candidatus Saccharimonadales bacterium]
LANDFGNLVNRTVTMAGRYLGGERPDPTTDGSLAAAWAVAFDRYRERFDGFLLHEALGALWEFVGDANRFVDLEQPWVLAKAAKGGDEAAALRLRGVLADLIEACRLLGLAAAPFLPATAPRVLGQLGYDHPYESDGNGGPPIVDALGWGAWSGRVGTLAAAQPLFPRLENEAAVDSAAG